jgi:hypothetical protein
MAAAVTNGSFHSQRLEALGGIACQHHHTAHTITAQLLRDAGSSKRLSCPREKHRSKVLNHVVSLR